MGTTTLAARTGIFQYISYVEQYNVPGACLLPSPLYST